MAINWHKIGQMLLWHMTCPGLPLHFLPRNRFFQNDRPEPPLCILYYYVFWVNESREILYSYLILIIDFFVLIRANKNNFST